MNSWLFASGIISLFSALGLCLIVLNREINEGVIIKVGLIGMIMSMLTTFALMMNESLNMDYYWRASFVLRLSILVVCFGLVVRARAYVKRTMGTPDFQESVGEKILRKVGEPVSDLAHLFNADSAPAPLEPQHDSRKRD